MRADQKTHRQAQEDPKAQLPRLQITEDLRPPEARRLHVPGARAPRRHTRSSSQQKLQNQLTPPTQPPTAVHVNVAQALTATGATRRPDSSDVNANESDRISPSPRKSRSTFAPASRCARSSIAHNRRAGPSDTGPPGRGPSSGPLISLKGSRPKPGFSLQFLGHPRGAQWLFWRRYTVRVLLATEGG